MLDLALTGPQFIGIVVMVFTLIGIASAVDAVMGVRTSQGATAWAVSLIAFPYVAVPLYWVFGRSKFEGILELQREHEDEIATLVGRVRALVAPAVDHAAEAIPSARLLQAISNRHFLGPNEVELLIDGEATFANIIAGIEQAERYVLVQFYIYRADDLGRRLGEALKRRARAGVKTLLIYDEIGSLGFSSEFRDDLLDAGVMVSAYGTTRGWRNHFQLNFRNHRKIVVVDGHTAWIGGHNVGDEYLGKSEKRGAWRDTHMRVTGPAALGAQATVGGDWFWATRTLLDLDWRPQDPPAGSKASVLVLPSGPSDKLETASLAAAEFCDMAKKRLWIASPYFIPDQAVMSALRGAALRGVDVRIMIPEKADSVPVHLASFWYLSELEGLGIRFFRYKAGFLHQKVVLVDDMTSVVGTMNWDSRSFRLNFEVSAVVWDEHFNDEVAAMLIADFSRSEEVDGGEYNRRSYPFRVGVKISRLLSPVL